MTALPRSTYGVPSNMTYARVHHIGPYAQNLAPDYTEDYPDGAPGITGNIRFANYRTAFPWMRGTLYLGTITMSAFVGYMLTTTNSQPASRLGKRRKWGREARGTIAGAIAGALLGIALDTWMLRK